MVSVQPITIAQYGIGPIGAEIAKLVHEAGGLVYMDGANMNAIQGKARPGDFGVDVMHFNLHKTFSTPHGGGGPGSGPVACKAALEPFLPGPRIVKENGAWRLDEARPKSIGKMKAFWGNVGMHIRAYTYIRFHGPEGIRRNAEHAVLNANYLMSRLKKHFKVAHDRPCMHEFVLDNTNYLKKTGVRTLDMAKRLFLTAEKFDADQMRACGFLTHLVADGELAAAGQTLANTLAGMAPLALLGMKKHLNALARGALDTEALALDIARCANSADLKEGQDAWVSRRPARFTGQ